MKDIIADHLESIIAKTAIELERHLLWRYPVGSVVRFYFCPAQRRRGTYSQGLVLGAGARGTNALRVRVVRKAGADFTHKGGERELDVLLVDIIATGKDLQELHMKEVGEQAWKQFTIAVVDVKEGLALGG